MATRTAAHLLGGSLAGALRSAGGRLARRLGSASRCVAGRLGGAGGRLLQGGEARKKVRYGCSRNRSLTRGGGGAQFRFLSTRRVQASAGSADQPAMRHAARHAGTCSSVDQHELNQN